MHHDPQDTRSRKALIAATLALVAIVAVAAAFFLGGQRDTKQVKGSSNDGQEYSFKAYTRSEAARQEQAPVKKEDDSGVPDEFDELAAKYGDQEVVVIEEYHEPEEAEEVAEPAAAKVVDLDEEAKYGPGEARPVNHETKSPADYQRQRYGSKEQQRLLRQFNEQLDRGERPVIPKARIPGQIRAFSPQVNRELKVNSNARFIPGKLHQSNSKFKPISKKTQAME